MRTPVSLVSELDAPLAASRAIATSRALLEAAAAGRQPETIRLFRYHPCVAFGPADTRAAGYRSALAAACRAGFEPAGRLEGGRAVAGDEDTLGISWTVPGADGRARIRPRFSLLAEIVVEALRSFGIDASIGPVPGEYCSGDFSVGVGRRVKLMGAGQRVTAGAAHLGAFIVVAGEPRLREVLTPVYDALGLDWESSTLGSVAAELGNAVTPTQVAERLIQAAARRFELRAAALPPAVAERASQLAGERPLTAGARA